MSVSNRARLQRLAREQGSKAAAARALKVSASAVRRWLERGVPDAVKTLLKRKTKKYYEPPKPKAKTKARAKAKPQQAQSKASAKKLSAKDSFILKSLERNHLQPSTRKKYLKELSANARKVLAAKTPSEPKTKPKKKLTEQDLFILSSWSDLSEDVQQKYFKKLSPLGKARIRKQEREHAKELEQDERARAAAEEERRKIPTPERMLRDLDNALNDEAWKAIREEVRFDKHITEPIVIQKDEDLAEASIKASVIPDENRTVRNPNRFYTVIAAVTQYPPDGDYSQKPVKSKTPLTMFYFSTESVNSEDKLPEAIAKAINNIRGMLPGNAPIAIVGTHVRMARAKT